MPLRLANDYHRKPGVSTVPSDRQRVAVEANSLLTNLNTYATLAHDVLSKTPCQGVCRSICVCDCHAVIRSGASSLPSDTVLLAVAAATGGTTFRNPSRNNALQTKSLAVMPSHSPPIAEGRSMAREQRIER